VLVLVLAEPMEDRHKAPSPHPLFPLSLHTQRNLPVGGGLVLVLVACSIHQEGQARGPLPASQPPIVPTERKAARTFLSMHKQRMSCSCLSMLSLHATMQQTNVVAHTRREVTHG